MFVSTFYVNRGDDELVRAVLVVVMCIINILMTIEIVVLLPPAASIIGWPVHIEYLCVTLDRGDPGLHRLRGRAVRCQPCA
jgi:hypothetical protein